MEIVSIEAGHVVLKANEPCSLFLIVLEGFLKSVQFYLKKIKNKKIER